MISHYRSQGGGRVQGSSLVTTGPIFETVQSITVSQSGPVQGGEGEGKGWRGINQVSSVSIQFGDFSC